MPKDFGPKQIAKKLKAAGLQKLRWYCQVCEKQCRDENGYRNHIQSESHQRKIMVVAENPGRQIESYSQEFLQGFMNILSRRYGSRRVFANQVYQEYISDRNHLHMNSTRWATLGEFCAYLGRRGLCKTERTDKGWYLEWIDTSPKEMARKEALAKIERMQKDQDERDRLMIEEQIEKGKQSVAVVEEREIKELKRDQGSSKISISLSVKGNKKASNKAKGLFSEQDDE